MNQKNNQTEIYISPDELENMARLVRRANSLPLLFNAVARTLLQRDICMQRSWANNGMARCVAIAAGGILTISSGYALGHEDILRNIGTVVSGIGLAATVGGVALHTWCSNEINKDINRGFGPIVAGLCERMDVLAPTSDGRPTDSKRLMQEYYRNLHPNIFERFATGALRTLDAFLRGGSLRDTYSPAPHG